MTEGLLLAAGILSSSFLGSWHCGVMCSPIATLMKTQRSLTAYHVGRMISYVILGVVAGAVGNFFLNHSFVVVRKFSALFLALGLMYAGLSIIFPEKMKGFSPLSLRIHKLIMQARPAQRSLVRGSGVMVGLLTAFLPCGWLYTYVAAALATQSPAAGGMVMFLFWLGGLPALSVIPAAMTTLINAAPKRRRQVAGTVLLIASLYSLWIFFQRVPGS